MNLFALHPGQHDCVTVINNFFSRARLEFYTRPQGQEQEPKLPPKLAGPLHKIIMTTNLNPVKVRAAGGGANPTCCDICGARADLLVTPCGAADHLLGWLCVDGSTTADPAKLLHGSSSSEEERPSSSSSETKPFQICLHEIQTHHRHQTTRGLGLDVSSTCSVKALVGGWVGWLVIRLVGRSVGWLVGRWRFYQLQCLPVKPVQSVKVLLETWAASVL